MQIYDFIFISQAIFLKKWTAITGFYLIRKYEQAVLLGISPAFIWDISATLFQYGTIGLKVTAHFM